MKYTFIIFALLFNVVYANNISLKNKPSHWCNLPRGYVEQSSVRGFNFMKLPLSTTGKHKGKYFVEIDEEIYQYIKHWKWAVAIRKNTCYAYRHTKVNRKSISVMLHRFIMGVAFEKVEVDHIDGNGLNCKQSNLRICTAKENKKNIHKKKKSSSQYLGVHRTYTVSNGVKSRFSWRAYISHNGKKNIHLGCFNIEEDAARAYDEAAKIYHGEFANLNFK